MDEKRTSLEFTGEELPDAETRLTEEYLDWMLKQQEAEVKSPEAGEAAPLTIEESPAEQTPADKSFPEPPASEAPIHALCGGEILKQGSLFKKYRCAKCGETHLRLRAFAVSE